MVVARKYKQFEETFWYFFNIAFLPTDRSRAEEKHDQSHISRKKIVGGSNHLHWNALSNALFYATAAAWLKPPLSRTKIIDLIQSGKATFSESAQLSWLCTVFGNQPKILILQLCFIKTEDIWIFAPKIHIIIWPFWRENSNVKHFNRNSNETFWVILKHCV